MWKSTEDIIKDLALLNDFSVPGDLEPYKILYSNGRGSKIKKKEAPEKFIDHRTGEIIDTDEIFSMNGGNLLKGVGRGELLGVSSKTKYQLQQQLRLARPLGSGDEAVESYFRRNKLGGSSTSTSESESEPQNNSLSSNFESASSDIKVFKPSIKAIRSSRLGTNALMNGLLSRPKRNCSTDSDYECDSCSSTEAPGCKKLENGGISENCCSSSVENAGD